MALTELNEQVRNKNIVICRSDKDGKLVVLNFDDYNKIMGRELEMFKKLDTLNENNIKKHFENIREKINDSIINRLHR